MFQTQKLYIRLLKLRSRRKAYFVYAGRCLNLNGVDANKEVADKCPSCTRKRMNQVVQQRPSQTQTGTLGIYGIIVAAAARVSGSCACLHVHYVDEAGDTCFLVLRPWSWMMRTILAYMTGFRRVTPYPNYTFVKMQDGSAPATGNSTTADIVVAYVYHKPQEAERFSKWTETSLLNTMTPEVQRS